MARKSDSYDNDDTGADIYELSLDRLVPYVDPADYGITDFVTVKPSDYFITSGDAVVKATHLDKAMWASAGQARRRFGQSKNKKHRELQRRIWELAGRCRSLLNTLKKIRGENVFLELEWRDHKLYCIPKNPRKKDDC